MVLRRNGFSISGERPSGVGGRMVERPDFAVATGIGREPERPGWLTPPGSAPERQKRGAQPYPDSEQDKERRCFSNLPLNFQGLIDTYERFLDI